MVRLLIDSGADVSFRDAKGRTLIDIALNNQSPPDIINLLLKKELLVILKKLMITHNLNTYLREPDRYYSFCKKICISGLSTIRRRN